MNRPLATSAVLLLALACGGADAPEPADAAAEAAAGPESARVAEEAPAGPFGTPPAAPGSEDPEVKALRVEVQDALRQLEDARARLIEAEQRAAERLAAGSNDEEIFRQVQRLLLTDPALSHVAIAAQVEDGVVTLLGSVPDAATAEAAIGIARATKGVGGVRSELRLVD